MKILAIDCGTQTGWAAYSNGIIESGVQDFSLKQRESAGMRFMRFRAWLHEMFINQMLTPLNLVVFEMAHHRGGAATEVLIGMTTRIQEECEKRKINYTSIHSQVLKKWATGSGRANKGQMLDEAQKRFGDHISDHNEADALLMMDWAREEFSE